LMALTVSCFLFRQLALRNVVVFSKTPNIWRLFILHCSVFKEHVCVSLSSPVAVTACLC